MTECYNHHYVTINARDRATDSWSNSPHIDRDTTNAICINGQGAATYPYHLDDQLCALYTAADMTGMAQAAAHKLHPNHLAAWGCRCESVEAVQSIAYGSELPEDLAANITILRAAGGMTDV